MEGPVFWIAFNVFVLAVLALDLGLLRRQPHVIKFREALRWSAFYIGLAAAFAGLVHWWRGPQKALEFVTGYLIEESLSVDNLFVFLVLFRYFRVEKLYQRKVLSWGIFGALVMRGIFIAVGVGLINKFHWIIYVFGAFLVYTGFTLLRSDRGESDPGKSLIVRSIRRWLPVTDEFDDGKFFTLRNGKRYATPLFLVLLVVEATDVLFATDSVPAVLAISNDPFIVYTSNVFAILGLRSLYFALAGMMELFHYLHYGLAVILMFVGVKMMISGFYELHTAIALGVIVGVLAISVGVSLAHKPKLAAREEEVE
jgi:tellurite resistance protein TerC